MRVRKRIQLSKRAFRSAITNGTDILAEVDGRSATARRYRDLIALHVGDLGGADAGLSEGQHCLVRRAACLTVQLEIMESKFAQDGGADTRELDVYQRTSNSLRRLLESLGIHRGRVARDVTPSLDEYLGRRGRRSVINGEVSR